MKIIKELLILALVLCVPANVYSQNSKPFTIPEIKEWIGGEGKFVCKKGIDDKRISFVINSQLSNGNDWYSINISPNEVTVTAQSETGLRNARQTLLQILEQSKDGSIPCGKISDEPDYRLRGFMLDCGRKFIPIEYLHNLLDIMAYYKMNTLQLHLNDNGFKQYFENDWAKTYAAFRLECDTYPGLTATDGFYSKKEFIELQKHGERVGVEIIPEIDIPAHCLAFTHYDPELGSDEFGMDHLNLRNPDKVYKFVDALLKEYLEGDNPVFRGKRMNIGTDEYSNRDSTIVEEFRRFTDHYIRYVESYGKQTALWGSLTHAKGKTPVKVDNVLMNCWSNGYADPKAMKDAGYQLVSIPDGYVYIVPAAGYYYDYLNCQFLYEKWTPAQMGNVRLEEKDPAIEGGMFAVWNDHVGNGISFDDIHHRTMPALQTIAEKTWASTFTTLPYETFDSLRHNLSEAPGINLLGRLDKEFTLTKVTPGMKTDVSRVGYDYTVTFDIDYAPEKTGTALFDNGSSLFYLTDPIQGQVGFSRDGYLFTFGCKLTEGHHRIMVKGTNSSTHLYIDDKLVSALDRHNLFFGEGGKGKRAIVPTLVFPLTPSKQFKSKVSNLKAVYQK